MQVSFALILQSLLLNENVYILSQLVYIFFNTSFPPGIFFLPAFRLFETELICYPNTCSFDKIICPDYVLYFNQFNHPVHTGGCSFPSIYINFLKRNTVSVSATSQNFIQLSNKKLCFLIQYFNMNSHIVHCFIRIITNLVISSTFSYYVPLFCPLSHPQYFHSLSHFLFLSSSEYFQAPN